ncbi:transcription/translation regulatory transformer protein RfaH [Pseudoalteromonas citrea]|uniref:Transcription/translation regulatory transformer protein RfaH n=1 Tax=Pseudoalteromonas citrea TaxID=43655 RepID=A0A5S3XRF9_9GAMM|nr:transcription/translation regulatory transformer protein RfaH [Pseudoalteromonas citrea]TMP45716.1 transcription/translation regulatory transformer protein RfaH [Pseudoalteromonas citrea]TMP59095.1 transcription/translation regulatory transformer protein RfaH [Pseudoalteromonas citrea]
MQLQENIDEMGSKQWFLVSCKSKQESRAHLNFTNQCIVSYYPTVEVAKISKGKRTVKNEALFPGYIFVYLDPSSYLASKVKNTLGVYGYVNYAGRPQVVPDSLISDLKEKSRLIIDESIQTGAKVVICDGVYKNIEGIFMQVEGDKRYTILIELLNQSCELSLNNTNVALLHN